MEPSLTTLDFKIFLSPILRRCKTEATDREYRRIISWALACLQDGNWPSSSYSGDPYDAGTEEFARAGFPLAGGLFAVIWTIKCDADWIGNGLKLEHASARLLCAWCGANCCEDEDDEFYTSRALPMAPWNDLSDDAEWRRPFL